jgi:hypothetical protein
VLVAACLALILLVGACACGEETTGSPTTNIDQAKDTSVKAAVLAIDTGVKAYIATAGEAPSAVGPDLLGGFVRPWPTNPYSKAPMQESVATGDYSYERLGGTSYRLSGHLSSGSDYTRP